MQVALEVIALRFLRHLLEFLLSITPQLVDSGDLLGVGKPASARNRLRDHWLLLLPAVLARGSIEDSSEFTGEVQMGLVQGATSYHALLSVA